MKIFVAGGTGAIGRPLIAKLLAKGHALIALTRSPEKAQALAKQGVEPAIADVFDADAVKRVVSRAHPEVVIEQLTALPKTYTRESMNTAAALNNRIRLEGGANVCGVTSGSQSHSMRFPVLDWQMKIRHWHLMPRLRLQQVHVS